MAIIGKKPEFYPKIAKIGPVWRPYWVINTKNIYFEHDIPLI